MLVLAVVFGLLPGFAWLAFYLIEEEDRPEPKRLILLTFLSGMAFGLLTIAIEDWWAGILAGVGVALFSILSLFTLAVIEEIMKFLATYFTAGRRSPFVMEPVERMLYMIVAAMGFATLENLGAVAQIPDTPSFVNAFFTTASLRFVGATLLHALTSGIVGYHWARGVAERKVLRNLAVGVLYASFLHAVFNYLILAYGNVAYTLALLIIAGFFVLNDFEKLKAKPVAKPAMGAA